MRASLGGNWSAPSKPATWPRPGATGSLLLGAILERERALARGGPRLLVPIPGHLAGTAGWPLDSVCRSLAASESWLVYRPGLLVRAKTIRQSSASAFRPTFAEHIESLFWSGGRLRSSVIMMDDVYTHGRTSTACRELLLDAGAHDVVLTCLAMTQL
jgi:predicted amidophosphoribosyltransferase